MKIKWLIQDNNLITSKRYRKYDALSFLNEKYYNIHLLSNETYINGLQEAIDDDFDLTTKYVFFAGITVLNKIKEANSIKEILKNPTEKQIENSDKLLKALKNGFFYDIEKFDQAYYSNKNLPLLNDEANYYSAKDSMDLSFEKDKFIKPSRDLKAFEAGILKKGQKISDYLKDKDVKSFISDENIVIADVKKIAVEYRFFVVNKKVITGSVYNLNGSFCESVVISDSMLKTANEYAKLYQPSEIFTLDLALLENGEVKIIEYNCFNCSGVYLCDLVKTYKTIKEFLIN